MSNILPIDFFVKYENDELVEPMNGPYPGDVTVEFRSLDGKRLRTSTNHVYAKAPGLIPNGWGAPEVIYLLESSDILNTLFKFINPGRYPNLLNVSFARLAGVTKAAEKYLVVGALNICWERMRLYTSVFPAHLLFYGLYYGRTEFIDKAAPNAVKKEPLENIVPLLPPPYQLTWIQYHGRWAKVLETIIRKPINHQTIPAKQTCWRDCQHIVLRDLARGVHVLDDIHQTFQWQVRAHTSKCSRCKVLCEKWQTQARLEIGKIPTFLSMINGKTGGSCIIM